MTVTVNKRRIIMRAFIQSQFGYCSLVWMFHNRKLNNRINKIHGKSLRVVYDEKVSTFSELLQKITPLLFTKGTSTPLQLSYLIIGN